MRRVAGAGLLIIALGGGHVAGWVSDPPARTAVLSSPPASGELPAPRAAASVAPAAARGTGLPAGYHADPLRFLSTAPSDSLELLPGIGPVLAARIVAHRAERGPFTSWTELDRVRGIGPATIRRLETAARRR